MILLRDVATGRLLHQLPHPGVMWLSFSPDGKHLASNSGGFSGDRPDCEIHVWEVATGKRVFTPRRGDGETFTWSRFAADGRLLFGTRPARLRTWNPETGAEAPPVPLDGEPRTGFTTPDGTHLLATQDGRPRLLDAATGKVVRVFGRDGDDFGFGNLSPDGQLAFGFGESGRVAVWDVGSGAERGRFAVPDVGGGFGPYVRFTPDGRYLLATWSQAAPGRMDRTPAAAVFTPDGRLVRRVGNVWQVEFGPGGASVMVNRRLVDAAGRVTGFDVTIHDAAAWLAAAGKAN